MTTQDSAMPPAKRSDWNCRPLPASHVTLPLDRRYSPEEMERIREGLLPEEMEDKWFIFMEGDELFLHRSWTGYCVFVARFRHLRRRWRLYEVDVSREPEEYRSTDDEEDARMMVYLVEALLLGKRVRFPYRRDDGAGGAIGQWCAVGRAMFR